MMVQQYPRLWRMALVAMCTLILCSCRSREMIPPPCPSAIADQTLIESSFPAPQGIGRPWPEDEYVVDGGHSGPPMTVGPNWQVNGLHVEDTIAHFDTLGGETKVQPSNRVYIYSPRFAAVRKVVGLVQNEQKNRSADVDVDLALVRYDDIQSAALGTKNIQAERERTARPASEFLSEQDGRHVSVVDGPKACQNALLPYENMSAIRYGIIRESEMARLAESTTAAITWSDNQAVQVTLDGVTASEAVCDQKAETIFTVKSPTSNPKLRVIKIASTQTAKQGETIYFTLRFDNVGNQVIGNITLLDNLSPRLEYIPESAQCSLDVDFSTERNESDSLLLRWDLEKPLDAGKGGVIRFQVRVR